MVTAWLGHMGRAWTGEPSDIAAALQHVHQAIQYLLRVRTMTTAACLLAVRLPLRTLPATLQCSV